ncbi:hypothetical protein [uncultured Brevibacillus sp.]|uniref:hypothetical protein n=1 Tax=uncultured Brevibacillus sp. TaxID=169970 RepID=UPI0025927D49|nr:hypothetical protein [uncultured Brevibacillus sp.]
MQKTTNLYNRLNTYIAKLDVLFDSGCTKPQALAVWKEFFNHDFWDQEEVRENVSKSLAYLSENKDDQDYHETEEFIGVDVSNRSAIQCNVGLYSHSKWLENSSVK